jgi:murein DD-endopeptidase
LVRTIGSRALGIRTSARPLLAYYSAGTYSEKPPAPLPLRGPVPPGEALAYGAAQLQGRPPREVARDLARLRAVLGSAGSDEAAVLALFCGEEPARWAAARADGTDLESLAAELPPTYADRIAQASQAIMLGAAYSLAWPLPAATPVTSPFGPREHPVLGGTRMHNGVDLGVPEQTPVRAVAAGVVRRASFDDSNGGIVILDHGRGVTTLYCHNDSLLVGAGDRVTRGQIISRSGSTGRSTGPHLHYQLELAGQPVDPFRYRVAHPRALAAGASD